MKKPVALKEESLLAAAAAARIRAYAPYSGFAVGAALLSADGSISTGANIENASFGLTVCAERNAVWAAVHAGRREFSAMAVVADCSPPPAPCGACRQVLWEMAGDIRIITGNLQGETSRRGLSQLLPEPFSGTGWSKPPSAGPLPGQAEDWRLPVTMRPVGRVVNNYGDRSDVPKNYRELLSKIVIDPDLEEGLYRLEEEKKIIVLGYLHRAGGYRLKEKRPGRGGEVYGVFACRAPFRPNPISHTEVELVGRRGAELTVRGLDLINGTPVLDLKTVLPPPGDS